MLGLLPEPGAVFGLPNDFLYPGIGFATAYCYTLAYALDIPDKATNFSIYMGFWFPDVSPYVWISIFIWFPLIFNYFNVRRYGNIEFTITSVKLLSLIAIVFIGFVTVAGGTDSVALLATDNNQPVFCGGGNQQNCLPSPGFICIYSLSFMIFIY